VAEGILLVHHLERHALVLLTLSEGRGCWV